MSARCSASDFQMMGSYKKDDGEWLLQPHATLNKSVVVQNDKSRHVFSSSNSRSVEWLMTIFMLGWALTLALPGDTLAISTYKEFRALGLNDTNLAVGYGSIGTVRLILLRMNGHFSRGPEVRFICSVISAFTWLITAILFALPWAIGGSNLPVSCIHHFIMFIAEIYTIGVNAVDRQLRR